MVGFGGGSPMDVAKLAAYLIATSEDLDRSGASARRWAQASAGARADHGGTGGATPVTVITVGSTEKRGVNSRALLPDWRCSIPS